MKNKIKRVLALILIMTLALSLSGCFTTSVDELYSPPELSEAYLQLQSKINGVLQSGGEFCAPTSGSYRQAVQLEDINGDGKNEAIAFFRFVGESKPLRVYIFRNSGEEYVEAARIEGDGNSIDRVNYTDMNGDGSKELVIGWQLGSDINMLSVYSMRYFKPASLISTDYSEYVIGRLTGVDSSLMVIRLQPSEMTGEAELFSLKEDGEVTSTLARLSGNIESTLRVRLGKIGAVAGAVYVENALVGGGIVTDIFTVSEGKLTNITLNETSGQSFETMRSYSLYCRDLNGDGVLDVPIPVALKSQSETTSYYLINWYTYQQDGSRYLAMTTYHNFSDSWYLVVPEKWVGEITIRREDAMSGERAIIFSYIDEEGTVTEDFLAIYALTGDNRENRSTVGDRFALRQEESTVYAAEVFEGEFSKKMNISDNTIRENFGLIYSEWITGET